MTFTGQAYALGAGTVINAIATWKGAAFGVDLKTFADVELTKESSSFIGTIEGVPQGDTTLIERSMELVLEHFGIEMGGTVVTRSEVPLASGLKSSSAAANATILATLDALGETLEPLDAVNMGVRAAKDAGVTITGAFDDACASFFGGIVVTDNRKNELVKRTEKEMDVVIFAPDRQSFSSQTNVHNSELLAPWVDMAYDLALEGEYEKAMTLNGFLYCGALGFSTDIMMEALKCGVKGVSLSGTGPAYSALVDRKMADTLTKVWGDLGTSGKVINTKINNDGLTKP
ncbi:shikimate kinase [Methanococcoides alaskense]|uniref:Shikimate kinase n=1 Tax=Methanococcoides alaskense TaxID=325778 RepID=A0AA90TZX4_9EURY|nr:shikimate kinase [Methanococcoides alaskense]MDA0524472.1 shikimate kinase [Methanococcoides alaskense]MDR6223291.1 shikimate kinase [Methanococcoides alaskense]